MRRQRLASGGRRLVAAAAATVLLALAAPGQVAAQQQTDWTVITDPFAAKLPGLEVAVAGPPQQPFHRPPPRTLDPHLLTDFAAQLNVLQDVSGEGDNTFAETSPQYVATVHNAFVEGEGGLVYDASGRAYHPPAQFFARTGALPPLPTYTPSQAAAACERHTLLASVVQRYGHMYYHFVMETLPRVALLAQSGRLTANTKLLTWGQPYEYEFLEALGVARSQVVPFNASKVYCADRLLVPTPTPRITPPREGLLAVRRGLGVRTLPEAERNLLVYVSRAGETSRRVANEQALLSAVRAAFPHLELAVFNGTSTSLQATVSLFQRARVVVGPHGAGLSHILFSAPGTTVIEFIFLADPPLMFWHAAGALGQPYWLLPVPQAYWMQEEMQVPTQEVLDILGAVLRDPAAPSTCLPGTFASVEDGVVRCIACSAGTYAYSPGAAACKPCSPGRMAPHLGSTACRTCQPGTYSSPNGKACAACPAGTFSALPGAWEAAQCLTAEQRRKQQESQALSVQLLSKLSPVFEQTRRRLIEQPGGSTLSQAELCAAQKLAGTFNDPYQGPYLAGVPSAAALLANCSNSSQVAAPPAYPEPSPAVIVVGSPPTPAPAPAPQPLPEVPVVEPPLPPIDVPALSPDVQVIIASTPSPSPEPEVQVVPPKKKVVDDYVIILACVLGSLLVLPLAAWVGRRAWLARQHRKARTSAKRSLVGAAPGSAPALGRSLAFSNPTFQSVPHVDEDAASISSSGAMSRRSPL